MCALGMCATYLGLSRRSSGIGIRCCRTMQLTTLWEVHDISTGTVLWYVLCVSDGAFIRSFINSDFALVLRSLGWEPLLGASVATMGAVEPGGLRHAQHRPSSSSN
ncbi:hypothetical protein CC80DRAFT_169330 [Byssothecium circinans]|uniref:Uncharacterized protein n=1 Tax=Byssothecium circinans TaxID=147558 RepID=A0A6A5TL83_9PLEO|nr:hypothetical protein CC80DRAFT_169330 [Byssothecium circinans]